VFFAQTKVVVGTTLPPSLSHSFGVQCVSKESNKEKNQVEALAHVFSLKILESD
jgi:hypothetical protein